MKNRKSCWIVVFLCLFMFFSCDEARTYQKAEPPCQGVETFEKGKVPTKEIHVATTGDASNDGTKHAPFATIKQAVSLATPGTAIVVHAGTYEGSNYISGLSGTKEAPIWIGGAKGEEKPIIKHTSEAMHFSKVHYLVVHDLKIQDANSNGINIDDAGEYANSDATNYVVFRDLEFSGIGTGGNQDCLKMSGVNHFWVLNNRFEGSGNGTSGSGVDMVGCHDGVIQGNQFLNMSGNGIQAKGGTEDIKIMQNHFVNAGLRSVNMGGSTGFEFFRPPLSTSKTNAEAKRIQVLANLIEGAEASLALVGCVECVIANNTIVNPKTWVFRILQETTSRDGYTFEPCRDNKIVNNLILFESNQIRTHINIGPNTMPESFKVSHNLWYTKDNPSASEPKNMPFEENNSLYGENPEVKASFEILASSVAYQKGSALLETFVDMNGKCYLNPPSIGAFEAE